MNFRALKLIDKTAFFLIVIAFLFTIIFPFYWIMLSSFTPKQNSTKKQKNKTKIKHN
jgi:ABC-type glycerol-3-phosphate transport system permease component